MDRGAWRATVHGVAKSQTQLSNWAMLTANSRAEVWISKATAFGDRAFEEVTKLKRGHEVGALVRYDWCPCEGETHRQECACIEGKPREHVRRRLSSSDKKGVSRNQPWWHPDLDPPKLWEDTFLVSFCCGRAGKLRQGLWGKAALSPLFRWGNGGLESRSFYFWRFKVSKLSSFCFSKVISSYSGLALLNQG